MPLPDGMQEELDAIMDAYEAEALATEQAVWHGQWAVEDVLARRPLRRPGEGRRGPRGI